MNFAISVIVPVYNNERILPRTIAALVGQYLPGFKSYELIFVDDGSCDGSLELLRAASMGNPRLRVMVHEKNLGQQQAIATGMLAATKDVVIGLDADLPCGVSSFQKVAVLAAQGCELVLGRRTFQKRRTWWRNFGSRIGNGLFKILFTYEIRDFGCSTAAVRRSLVEKFRRAFTSVYLIKIQLLSVATDYMETDIDSQAPLSDAESGYSVFSLAKLLWLMLLSRVYMGGKSVPSKAAK